MRQCEADWNACFETSSHACKSTDPPKLVRPLRGPNPAQPLSISTFISGFEISI